MSELYNQFFSPLGKEWCAYFLYLMYFSFAALVMTVLASIYDILQKKPKFGVSQYLFSIINAGVMYFVNRLMYSICVN
jgi:hypothetical protein